MNRQRIRHWYGVDQSGDYHIKPGKRLEVRVLSVARNGIRVEAYGVESFIPVNQLSYSIVRDARELYYVGDRAITLIENIERSEDGQFNVNVELSVKKATKDPRINGLRFFRDGCVYHGIISYISINKQQNLGRKPYVSVTLAEGIECKCPYPWGSVTPRIGAKVALKITSHNTEQLRLFGLIQHIF